MTANDRRKGESLPLLHRSDDPARSDRRSWESGRIVRQIEACDEVEGNSIGFVHNGGDHVEEHRYVGVYRALFDGRDVSHERLWQGYRAGRYHCLDQIYGFADA